jgi:hypothetical protein
VAFVDDELHPKNLNSLLTTPAMKITSEEFSGDEFPDEELNFANSEIKDLSGKASATNVPREEFNGDERRIFLSEELSFAKNVLAKNRPRGKITGDD